MNQVHIRAASLEDRAKLCQLYYAFHEFHVQGVPDRLQSMGEVEKHDWSYLMASLAKIIEADNAALFIAEIEGQIIGLAEVYFRQDEVASIKVAHQHGYLQSLMVLEQFQRQGVGKLLVETAEAWAKTKGATEMQLEIWDFPVGPLRFYEKLGYRGLRQTLVRNL